jgi:hypothetical protein
MGQNGGIGHSVEIALRSLLFMGQLFWHIGRKKAVLTWRLLSYLKLPRLTFAVSSKDGAKRRMPEPIVWLHQTACLPGRPL